MSLIVFKVMEIHTCSDKRLFFHYHLLFRPNKCKLSSLLETKDLSGFRFFLLFLPWSRIYLIRSHILWPLILFQHNRWYWLMTLLTLKKAIVTFFILLQPSTKKKSQCLINKKIKINLNLGALAPVWLWQLYLCCGSRGGAAPWPPHLLKLYSDLGKCLDDDGNEHIL